jgi:hypothetical protein
VIAPQRFESAPGVRETAPPPRQVERVRSATRRRSRRNRRALHAPVRGVIALTLAIFLPLIGYVWLTANVTSMSYALARTERERIALVEETQRADDRIARLTSPDRLEAIAGVLKMHDPSVYAVVMVPVAKPPPHPAGIAFFATWFGAGR